MSFTRAELDAAYRAGGLNTALSLREGIDRAFPAGESIAVTATEALMVVQMVLAEAISTNAPTATGSSAGDRQGVARGSSARRIGSEALMTALIDRAIEALSTARTLWVNGHKVDALARILRAQICIKDAARIGVDGATHG